MTYQEAIHYLYTSIPSFQAVGAKAYKPGLGNILTLDEYFAHPHRAYKTIHVGGTNGKGSTSHTLASILQEAGYKVGLFTSPHLLDFRERIRVNGQVISEERVCQFVESIQDLASRLKPSFFELTTILALLYFKEQEVDIAIIEVGLGGRLDSSNIIEPILSVITNISLDHTQFLGHNLSDIAYEKAGIIKKNTPIVIGERQVVSDLVFEQYAKEMNAPLHYAEEEIDLRAEYQADGSLLYETELFGSIYGELKGYVQQYNARTILSAIKLLQEDGWDISTEAIHKGFASVTQTTGLLGRWQRLQDQPLVVCDTAHNKAGLEPVIRQILAIKHQKLRIIIGFANDKDISSMLALLPSSAQYYLTQARDERAMPVMQLKELTDKLGLESKTYQSVKEAVKGAMAEAKEDDLIFIGGSNFIIAEALPLF